MSQIANPWIPLFITNQNFIQAEAMSEPDARHFL